MYSETITLFNRYHSRTGDMWYPHVLQGVNLIIDRASIMAKYGAQSTDRANLHIKYKDGLIVGDKPYIEPKEWAKLTNDELADYITFNADSNFFDFFIVGDYEDESVIFDRDYPDGFFNHMEEETECYALSSVSSPYKVIKHFEIMAK